MAEANLKTVAATVSSIGKDAQALVDELQPKAQQGKNLTVAEEKKIAALIKRSDAAMSAAKKRAVERRQEQIAELEKLTQSIKVALGTPGLSAKARKDMKRVRTNKLTQLNELKTKASFEFGGILSEAKIKEIGTVLKEARDAVGRRKKAAAWLGSLFKVANLSIGIVGKLGGIM